MSQLGPDITVIQQTICVIWMICVVQHWELLLMVLIAFGDWTWNLSWRNPGAG
ncbi:hypothetical protein MC118_005218 [Salmonella enterica]|nr:hypothetical protein [Salmonella enterica]